MERDDHLEQLREAAERLAVEIRQSIAAGATITQISVTTGIPEHEIERIQTNGVRDQA